MNKYLFGLAGAAFWNNTVIAGIPGLCQFNVVSCKLETPPDMGFSGHIK